ARLEARLAESAERVSAAAQGELRSSLDALRVLSQSELFQQGRIAALGRLLQGRPRGDWDSVFLLDRDGSVVLDTAASRRGPGWRDLLQSLGAQVVKTGEPAVSGYTSPQDAPGNAVWIALPVLQGASVRYVLGARMTDATWQRIFT